MATLKRYRGDTRPDAGTVEIDEVAIPIDGCSFTLTVDPEENPTTADNNLFSLTGVIVNATAGTVKFPITAEQANQTPGEYWHDIQMVDGEGLKHTISKGGYLFYQDITKA